MYGKEQYNRKKYINRRKGMILINVQDINKNIDHKKFTVTVNNMIGTLNASVLVIPPATDRNSNTLFEVAKVTI